MYILLFNVFHITYNKITRLSAGSKWNVSCSRRVFMCGNVWAVRKIYRGCFVYVLHYYVKNVAEGGVFTEVLHHHLVLVFAFLSAVLWSLVGILYVYLSMLCGKLAFWWKNIILISVLLFIVWCVFFFGVRLLHRYICIYYVIMYIIYTVI